MSLSPQERRRIYEEEKARVEGQTQTPVKKQRRGCLFGCLALMGILVVLGIIGSLTKGPQQQTRQPQREAAVSKTKPKIILNIQSVEYTYGAFKVVGTARNAGDTGAFSPTIELHVYDSTGDTLLARDTAWPAGQMLSTMAPGSSAAFQLIALIPGEPRRVSWSLTMRDFPFECRGKEAKACR